MNLRDLFLRVRALVSPSRVERELDEELAFHIEYDTQRHIANGLSAADARARARARFGPVSLVADQCRDARGTALIDDVARDVRYALRTFRRAPLAAFTIVATVALGLGLVAAVFTFFNAVLRVDAAQNPGELFAVEWPAGPGAGSSTPFTRAALVLSQSALPVGLGLLAGGGLAAGLAIVLTATLGSESSNTVRVFDPMAYAASLLVIVIACVLAASVPALRAARVDPIATLRND